MQKGSVFSGMSFSYKVSKVGGQEHHSEPLSMIIDVSFYVRFSPYVPLLEYLPGLHKVIYFQNFKRRSSDQSTNTISYCSYVLK